MSNLSGLLLNATVLIATTAAAHAAGSGPSVQFLDASAPDPKAQAAHRPQFNAWMWSDDYVYMPGDSLNAWWTVKPNSDLLPITIVGYVQNNQTGDKLYFPNLTDEPTDIFGNSADQGFRIIRVPGADRAPLIGNGGMFSALTIPNQLGMHTLVVEFRDYTGNTPLKRIYQKISVVDEIVMVPNSIEADTTWVRTKSYLLVATTFVRGATLTIEDGTIIKGETGSFPAASLIIRNDSMLIAEGTRSRPIIFTSSLEPGNRSGGDWGGVALLGTAPTNQVPNFIEGLPESDDTAIGGDDPTHDCGSLSYVRVEFAGAQLDQDNELNALTFGSCGSDTRAHHLQAHYGFDDSFEWFGGTNDVKYLVATAGSDDGLDLQLGYTGRVQFFAAIWYDDAFGDHGIEADNRGADNSAEPFSTPQVYNATFVGNGICDDGCDGGRLRRGLKGSFNNIVLTNFFDNTLQFTEQVTFDNLASGELSLNGFVVYSNERELNAPNTLEGQFMDDNALMLAQNPDNNFVIARPRFRSLEQSDWDLRADEGSILTSPIWELPPSDGFFEQGEGRCAGAFCGEEDWTEEWTNKLRESDLVRP